MGPVNADVEGVDGGVFLLILGEGNQLSLEEKRDLCLLSSPHVF